MKSKLIVIVIAVLLVGCGPPKPPVISIHKAAAVGNIEAVNQHLAAGTDVAKHEDGWTPLYSAVIGGHKEIVELLITNGGDVNAISRNDGTVLDWADGEIADLLLKHGGKTGEELKAEGK